MNHPNYPGEAYFRTHNPLIRKAEEDWERNRTVSIERASLIQVYLTAYKHTGFSIQCRVCEGKMEDAFLSFQVVHKEGCAVKKIKDALWGDL